MNHLAMRPLWHRRLRCLLLNACLILCLGSLWSATGYAETVSPAQVAERVRGSLTQAQLDITADSASAHRALADAQASYAQLATQTARLAPDAHARSLAGLAQAVAAIDSGHELALADARGQIWTAILDGAYQVVQQSLMADEIETAQTWLTVREFRRATRFSRPGADATRALADAAQHTVAQSEALLAVHADFLDTYQARLTEALANLRVARSKNFPSRVAEYAALADGYFAILAPAYAQQHGTEARITAQATFTRLREAARTNSLTDELLSATETVLKGFRAAPLAPAEQVRRAGQLTRFLNLVAIEYGRGVKNGVVTRDFEIQEAITFRNGAAAAFADLQTLLEARDPRTAQVAAGLTQLEQRLAAAIAQMQVADAGEIEGLVKQTTALLTEIMPVEWQIRDAAADFDVIQSILDQVESAVAAGGYDRAESARLEAYAVLETGPEARLIAFAPQHIAPLEDLFWYGQGDQQGLGYLIQQRASLAQIRTTRAALAVELDAAQKALVGGGAPLVVATNAGVIVFREGLEAVLILASLIGSLRGTQRRLARPMWWGAGAAMGASILTWLLARGILTQLARYGEKLEAIVSLIAIVMLLLITNWFFHKAYWVDWMAQFHQRKQGIIRGSVGQWLGLATLGFTSIYREGFETVIFLQALVLEGGSSVVLAGVGVGLLATALIGLTLFTIQRKLPFKKMLIVTGMMIVGVLIIMVGNTVHVLQVVGWFPIHPIRGLSLPYWTGLWFGLYATWEGIALQIVAGVFVVGSYFLAERLQNRRTQTTLRTASTKA